MPGLLAPAETLRGDDLEHALHQLLVGEHFRRVIGRILDVILRDRVDLDVVACYLDPGRTNERVLRAPGRTIAARLRDAAQRRRRGNRDDLARLARDHLRQHGPRQAHQRMHHRVEILQPVLVPNILRKGLPPFPLGQIRDQHINHPRRPDRLLHGLGRRQILRVRDDLRPFFPKDFNHRRAHIFFGTRHQHALAIKKFRHATPSLLEHLKFI